MLRTMGTEKKVNRLTRESFKRAQPCTGTPRGLWQAAVEPRCSATAIVCASNGWPRERQKMPRPGALDQRVWGGNGFSALSRLMAPLLFLRRNAGASGYAGPDIAPPCAPAAPLCVPS